MRKQSGLTILELLFALVLVVFLVTSISMIYVITIKGWDNLGHRSDLHKKLIFGLERIGRDVSEAKDIAVSNQSLRFTLREAAGDVSYIYYLHNASDSWPPNFNQASYNLMRTNLTGGINGTFTYGTGEIIVTNLKPPAFTNMALSGDTATLTLTGQEKNDSITVRQAVCARNRTDWSHGGGGGGGGGGRCGNVCLPMSETCSSGGICTAIALYCPAGTRQVCCNDCGGPSPSPSPKPPINGIPGDSGPQPPPPPLVEPPLPPPPAPTPTPSPIPAICATNPSALECTLPRDYCEPGQPGRINRDPRCRRGGPV